jgi:prevent-host-death family protein
MKGLLKPENLRLALQQASPLCTPVGCPAADLIFRPIGAKFDHRYITMVKDMSVVRTISAGEFKAKCLKLMDYVNQSHQVIVITKHNKPVARLTPITDEPKDVFGCMKNTVTIKSNIIDPIDVLWKEDNE